MDSLDLRHDVPQMKFHECDLSHEDMGMVRYEDPDDEDILKPVPMQEIAPHVPFEVPQSNSDPFQFGSANRSNSLGIQYVEADDCSSDEEDNHGTAQLKGGKIQNDPRPQSTRKVAAASSSSFHKKSSHNISQHAIDALLGVSSASQERPQQMNHMVNPHFFERSPVEEKADDRHGRSGPAIFAISSDRESEMEAPSDHLRKFYRPPMIVTPQPIISAPMEGDVRVTRRIASHAAGRSTLASSPSNTTGVVNDAQTQQPAITTPPPVMHLSVRQTVPFDGSGHVVSPVPTDGGTFFPPEVSPTDTNIISQAVVQTPPNLQGRNTSPQRLPSRWSQQAAQHQQQQQQALAASVSEAINPTRQTSQQLLGFSSAELPGPGMVSVPVQRQPSIGHRRVQEAQDIHMARRRSMSPTAQSTSNTNVNLNHSYDLQQQLAMGNIPMQNTYGMPVMRPASRSRAMNPAMLGNNLRLPGHSNTAGNNWALQQAILHQQQMQQLQQQQLQQLQQQQQQLHLMASMGMTTVPMVANTGMIYQQPIMTVMQNNVMAMNSLTQSIAASVASLALITAPPAATPTPTSRSMLTSSSLASSSGLISPSMIPRAMSSDMTVLTNAATPTMSLEEQLLTRQREVERENDMQLSMAIEQSLQEAHQQQQYHPQPDRRHSSATWSSVSSTSRSTSQHQVLEHHATLTAHPSRTASPAIHAHIPTSSQTSVLVDETDDVALQMALMISLEEQLYEQQSALQQAHEQSFGPSRSPAIRQQQQVLLSRQESARTSRNLSPGPSSSHHQSTSSHYQSQYESRAPSRERVVNFQRRSRDEILHDRKSRSTSPTAYHPSPLYSGMTSHANSNNSSFRDHSGPADGHHASRHAPPPTYHNASFQRLPHHNQSESSYAGGHNTGITMDTSHHYHSAQSSGSSQYDSFPSEYTAPPPAYHEATQQDPYLGIKTKTLVRRSSSVECGRVPDY